MSSDDELKVVDADGEEVAAGEVGELLTRGPVHGPGLLSLPQNITLAPSMTTVSITRAISSR